MKATRQENLSGSSDSGEPGNNWLLPSASLQAIVKVLFLGPTESREPDGFFCWQMYPSLFVFLYHDILSVNEIAIQIN